MPALRGTHKRFKSNKDLLPLLSSDSRTKHQGYERYEPKPRETLQIWPRRLLYIPTMTSVERTGENVYGEHEAPSYCAISYTWGRFAVADGPALKVKNVPWRVPPVNPSHFSVEDFEAAIQTAGASCPFLWVDIACIDQQNFAIKLDEIGKQAAIFRRASKVFAWLAPWGTEDLEKFLATIEAFSTLDDHATIFKVKHASKLPERATVDSLLGAIEGFRNQPWFTSLWTLQEAYLCKLAVVLPRSSEGPKLISTLDESYETPMVLQWILIRCQQIFINCMLKEDAPSRAICKHLMDSGILALNAKHEWTLYSASTKRRTRRQDDHVYGIMQVFDLDLGAQPSFSALEDKFGSLLNIKNIVLAQMQVHEVVPAMWKAWRVSQHMTVPALIMDVLTSTTLSEFRFSPRKIPYWTGSVCALDEIMVLWQSASERLQTNTKDDYHIYALLDATDSQGSQSLEVTLSPCKQRRNNYKDMSSSSIALVELPQHLPLPSKSYHVLMLGYVEMITLQHAASGLSLVTDFAVGLLARQRVDVASKPFLRVGVCLWQDDARSNPDEICVTYREDNPDLSVPVVPIPEGMWKQKEVRLA